MVGPTLSPSLLPLLFILLLVATAASQTPPLTCSPILSTSVLSSSLLSSLLSLPPSELQTSISSLASSPTELTAITHFLAAIQNLQISHANSPTPKYTSLAFLGAGPSALINALVAYSSGLPASSITIHERRAQYDRDIWFDIASSSVNSLSANHDSLQFFLNLGVETATELNYKDHRNLDSAAGRIMTMPCAGLQNFLAKILISLGCNIYFESPQTLQTIPHTSSSLVVIADGAHSSAREALHINDAPPPHDKPHTTLIARLAPTPSKSCPTHHDVDPYYPAFQLFQPHGVTSVFKRFFHDHCELQIFFSSDVSKDAVDTDEVLEAVLDVIMEDASGVDVIDQKWFEVSVRRAEKVAGTDLSIGDYIVIGDAALTAHYRLGIGINHAVMMAERFLPKLLHGETTIAEYNDSANAVNSKTEQVMARFVKYESECNLVLFEEEVFRRDYGKRSYEFIYDDEINRYCETRAN